jgi:hypothetical protein
MFRSASTHKGLINSRIKCYTTRNITLSHQTAYCIKSEQSHPPPDSYVSEAKLWLQFNISITETQIRWNKHSRIMYSVCVRNILRVNKYNLCVPEKLCPTKHSTPHSFWKKDLICDCTWVQPFCSQTLLNQLHVFILLTFALAHKISIYVPF